MAFKETIVSAPSMRTKRLTQRESARWKKKIEPKPWEHQADSDGIMLFARTRT